MSNIYRDRIIINVIGQCLLTSLKRSDAVTECFVFEWLMKSESSIVIIIHWQSMLGRSGGSKGKGK